MIHASRHGAGRIGWRGLCNFALAVFILAPLPLAEASDPPAQAPPQSCYEGEYVITLSEVGPKRDKAIDAVEDAANGAVEVIDESERAMLVYVDDSEDPGDGRALCDSLEEQRRDIIRQNRATGSNKIVRRVSCGCNTQITALAAPSDSYYPYQWGLNQANDIDVDAPEAWTRTKGSRSVVVAVIDSGVEYSHPDLAANMWRNPGEVPGNGVDDDGNGYIDDYHGINAITGSGDPIDDNGHGTHVAGVIGARTDNLQGIAGLNWDVSIIAVKFLGSSGSGSLFDAIKSIDYVTALKQRGINIVASNNSWGGGPFIQPLYDAIARARSAGVLFVAAAGNAANNNDANPSYPSCYDLDNIISIAAVDSQGNLASFSNYGSTSVDMAAPGVNIASTYTQGRYVYLNGTSMAAPFATGALALLAAQQPALLPAEMKAVLMNGGMNLNSLTNAVLTGRMVNASRILDGDVDKAFPDPAGTPPAATPTPTPTPTPLATPEPGIHDLSGIVRLSGTGLAGARVVMTLQDGSTIARFTGPNGQYLFADVTTPARYTLTVEMSGYSFAPRSGELVSDTVLNFDATANVYRVSGIAVTRDKTPLGGVTVDAGEHGRTQTDSQGRFVLDVPFGTRYTLLVSPGGDYDFDENQRTGVVYGNVERVFVAKLESE